MPIVELPFGPIEYQVFGPESPNLPTVVFVHGFLVNGTLWYPVAEQLASAGIRSIVPDWPLGAHRIPTHLSAELSPNSLATALVAMLDSLDLRDAILVGNDTGGAICQLAVRGDHQRVGALVLTNCDAFDTFPPKFFVPVFVLARYRSAVFGFLQVLRPRLLRHSPLVFGRLLSRPRSAETTRGWVEPALCDSRIRRDITRFARGLTRNELRNAKSWLSEFEKPTRIVWGSKDRLFPKKLGVSLADAFPHAVFVEVAGAATFVSLDKPDAVAKVIIDLFGGLHATDGSPST